ncbi:MAG: SusC/RagA family TonB-linked outer membrane protein [Ferruginibacter sp.]
MSKNIFTFILLICCCITVNAQSEYTGKISDRTGNPIPDATIKVKNSATTTTSGPDGSFKIMAKENASITVTVVGYGATELSLGNERNLKILLDRNERYLEEVVVTALGIKREKRNLTFSSQEVKSEELLRAKDPNVVNAIAGKVSGVQITNSSGTPGGSARIVVRGTTSIFGKNEALIVLDGIPIDNSETGSIASGPGSNRLVDIDPSIIENVNVLKGAAATALYGSSGARGVVIITTKNGAGYKKPLITLSSDLGFDQALYPDVQSKYAQGDRGVYYNGEDQKSSSSWGPLMDTLRVNGAPVEKRNQMKDFFRTGRTTNNTISVGGSNPNSGYFFSYSYFDQQGTVPQNDFKRHNVFTKFNTKIGDKFTAAFQFNYSNSARHTVPEGYILESPIWTIFTAPISWNPLPYLNPDGTQRVFRFSRNNPYWTLDNVFTKGNVNRFLPVATFTYNPAKWLSITERVGADIYSEQLKYYEALNSVANPNGVLEERTNTFRQFNHDLIISAKKQFGNFDINVLVGNNILSSYGQSARGRGVGLSVDNFYNLANAATQTYSETHSLQRKVGFYTQANIDYKKLLVLSLTGRYDGSSVLWKEKNFYPYGSAAMSFVFSELLSRASTFLNFGKIRVSYATVGNDNVDPYKLTTAYEPANVATVAFPFQGQNGFLLSQTLGNPYIKNELVKEFEVGLETRILNNKLGVEVSYFNKNMSNGIIQGVLTSSAIGYTGTTVNTAKLNTKGVELLINATPVKTKNFNWDVVFNFTKINNKVLFLNGDIKQLSIGFTQAMVDQPYGVIFGDRFKRTAQGQLIIDAAGLPVKDDTQGILGNISPDWTAGITNTLTYRNWSFSFFFDMKKGGDIQNNVDGYGYFYGMPKVTENRQPRVIEGISEVDNKPNTVMADAEDYYRRLNSVLEAVIQDGTYIKLRNVTLGYTFRGALLSKTPFKSASVVVTGRNLLIHRPNFTGSDPEASSFGSANGSQGLYSFSTPTSRTVNFGLKLTF